MFEAFHDEVFPPTQPLQEWLDKPSGDQARHGHARKTRWPQAGRRSPQIASRRDTEPSFWAVGSCLLASIASAGTCLVLLILAAPADGVAQHFWKWVVGILVAHAISLVASIYMVLLSRPQAARFVAASPTILVVLLMVAAGALLGVVAEALDLLGPWLGWKP